ncbi:MAG: hypothetical protein R2861_01155 [Desulfobacterales bacterium]
MERIEKRFAQLSAQPESGVYPKELVSLGIRDFRKFFQTISHHLPGDARNSLHLSHRRPPPGHANPAAKKTAASMTQSLAAIEACRSDIPFIADFVNPA